MNIIELEEFIEELNELLRSNKGKFQKLRPNSLLDGISYEQYHEKEKLTETEAKVYILISHYFRLLTLTVPNLSVAYEIWLKGILKVLMSDVGLTLENWDRICTIGDHDSDLQDRMDTDLPSFLDQIKLGKMNEEVWELIQKGKKRSNELMKKRVIRRKKRSD